MAIVKALFSIIPNIINGNELKELYDKSFIKDDEYDNSLLYPPTEYGFDGNGKIVYIDESEYFHNILENPTDEDHIVFEIAHYETPLEHEIDGAGITNVFDEHNFHNLISRVVENKKKKKNNNLFDFELNSIIRWNDDDRYLNPKEIQFVVSLWYSIDYWGEHDSDIHISGYLDEDKKLIEF
jgi:hypothetical protein